MTNILSLTKVFFKGFLNAKTKTKKQKILTSIGVSALVIYFIGIIYYFSSYFIDELLSIRQVNVFAALIVLVNIGLIFFTCIISSINILYFSKDNLFILPLPLKPHEVLISKINVTLIYEYLEELLLGLLPMIIFGIKTNQSIVFYVFLIIVLIFLPIIPLLLGLIIIMSLMSTSKLFKNKNTIQILTMIFAISISIFASMFSSTMQTSSQAEMVMMIMKTNGLANIFKKYLPNANWAIEALTEFNIISLLLLVIISLLIYVLVVALSQKLYYKGMLGTLFSSSGISKKKLDVKKAYKTKGLAVTYVLNEFKTYIRKPVYLVQLAFPCLFIPILFCFIFYFSFKKGAGEDFETLMNVLFNMPNANKYVFLATMCFVFFTTSYCFISCIAISKDGSDAPLIKIYPINFYKQLIYKMIPDIIMVNLMYLNVTLILIILFKIPFKFLYPTLFIIFPYSILHAFLILIDIKKPKLTWNNEMQLVKNNFRILFSIVLGIGAILLLLFFILFLDLNVFITSLILTIIFLIIDIILILYIYNNDILLAKNII